MKPCSRPLVILFTSLYILIHGVFSTDEARKTEQTLIKRFEAEEEIPTYKGMQQLVGTFREPKMEHISNEQLFKFLKELTQKFPSLTHLYSIGKSVQKRKLWVLVVSKFPKQHKVGVPEFKYVANMHGDEVAGRVFLTKLAWVLLHNYGSNEYLTRLVDSTRIHFLATMNPDGYALAEVLDNGRGRQNANGKDLNRNFPKRFPNQPTPNIQPETQAVMDWSLKIPFSLSANIHGGTNLVNYPWDDSEVNAPNFYAQSPDNELFVRIAYAYARSNSRMWKRGPRCLEQNQTSSIYPDSGITNGNYWYSVAGGMQDWIYRKTKQGFDVTVEISCRKFPDEVMLQLLWDENKYALIQHIQQVHNAIHGQIVDANTGKGLDQVLITIRPRGKPIWSFGNGEFWRLINLGVYELTFSKKNYLHQTVNVTVTKENRSPEIIIQMVKQEDPIEKKLALTATFAPT